MRSFEGVPILAWILMALVAVSCSPSASSRSAGENLTVAAAADLQFAFTEIGRRFEEETGAQVTFVFGSSGNLARQIENGAPVDLFASADEEYVRQLAARGAVVPDTTRLFALGRLALVYFKGSDLRLNGLEDLSRAEVTRLALANPDHAPYGRAAREALTAAGLWDRVKPKVVYGENVRQALQFVETGNADAGIVALSIVEGQGVGSVAIDESLYQPLRQSMAVVKGSRHDRLARDFAAFVNGPIGSPIMKRYGFTLPGEK